jgi:transposase InsO family protein
MHELTVESNGMRITLETSREADLWEAAKAAFNAVLEPKSPSSSNAHVEEKKEGSKADRVRRIAKGILSDGKAHERREISRAVREAGLNPQTLTKTLEGHFERGENAIGRPTYRDRTVPSGYSRVEDLAAVGTWSGNGIELNGGHG